MEGRRAARSPRDRSSGAEQRQVGRAGHLDPRPEAGDRATAAAFGRGLGRGTSSAPAAGRAAPDRLRRPAPGAALRRNALERHARRSGASPGRPRRLRRRRCAPHGAEARGRTAGSQRRPPAARDGHRAPDPAGSRGARGGSRPAPGDPRPDARLAGRGTQPRIVDDRPGPREPRCGRPGDHAHRVVRARPGLDRRAERSRPMGTIPGARRMLRSGAGARAGWAPIGTEFGFDQPTIKALRSSPTSETRYATSWIEATDLGAIGAARTHLSLTLSLDPP